LIITAWRIFKPKHQAGAFTGEGARRFGGRWNSKGVAVIYTADSLALAALEMLVYLQAHRILDTYLVAPVRFHESLVRNLDRSRLPADWRRDPVPLALRSLGDQWVAGNQSLVLRVPSVIIESECNYLLNPAHPDFAKLSFGRPQKFRYDSRLAK
jgi:RES domain-containing protein